MELQPKAFDVETAFAMAKKRQTKKCRGPDSLLYTAICPAVYIIRIFGLAPYEFSKDRLVPSNFYLIFSVIFQLLYSYVIYANCYRFHNLQRETLLMNSTEYIKIIFNYCMITYDILMTIQTRQKFTRIWNSMQDYDDAVRILGYPQKETKTKIMCWLFILFNTVLWVVVNRSGMYAFGETWLDNMCYMCMYVGSCVAVYKFVGITLLLGQRFHHFNEMTQKCVPSKNRYYRFIKIDLKTIHGLHNELMIVGESLNSLYTTSLLLWLANLSLHSVGNLYIIIGKMFISNWTEIPWRMIVCLLIWLLAFISQLVAIHIACSFTSNQANSIGKILIDWQIYLIKQNAPTLACCQAESNSNKEISIADSPKGNVLVLMKFLNKAPPCISSCFTMPVESTLHFLGRRLQFSAAGCFYIDLPLMRSIAASITTYLVILLQLQ